MVAVSSPPMGTSRWITSATVTSGTGGAGGAVFSLQPAARTAAAPIRRPGRSFEAIGTDNLLCAVTASSSIRPLCRRRPSLDRVALALEAGAEGLVELGLRVRLGLLRLVLRFLLRGGVRLLLTGPSTHSARGRADRGPLSRISGDGADRGAGRSAFRRAPD